MHALGNRVRSPGDFGTGYSSFSYLTQLPFRPTKIDRPSCATSASKIRRHPRAKTIIGMANNLGLK